MSQQYQIMQYVLQWSPSFCQISNCENGVSQKFSIHGLWPAYGNGHSIHCKCSNITEENEKVKGVMKSNSNLKNLFRIIWPNLKDSGPSYDWLWKHEWENHGCCIGPSLTTTQYFEAAEKIHQNFFVLNGISINLTNYLVQGGVQPSNSVLYSGAKIRGALSRLAGNNIDIYLSCYRKNNNILFKEVHFCFDTKITRFISCPLLQNGLLCNSNVILPTF
uniref:RNase Phy3 n=2 Tax=Solanum tuberosum TaxID=4113 RepID=M1CHR0_SOLTU